MPARTKAEIARANGAKSQGPVTPEGRARSSQNALRHGLSAETVVLPGEDAADFEDLRASYIERFQPANRPELELVEAMTVARWRLRRIYSIETEMLDNELVLNKERIDDDFNPDIGFQPRLAWVFQSMANDGKALATLLRYEGHLTRTYERARKELQVLQTPPPAPCHPVAPRHPAAPRQIDSRQVDPLPAPPPDLRNEPRIAASSSGFTPIPAPAKLVPIVHNEKLPPTPDQRP